MNSPAVREQLAAMAAENQLAKEQYLDFLKGRSFRQTLLCQAQVCSTVQSTQTDQSLYLRSPARPFQQRGYQSKSVEEFRGRKEASASTDLPLLGCVSSSARSIRERSVSTS